MRPLFFSIIAISGFLFTVHESMAQGFNIATYNIRFYAPPDTEHSWKERRPEVTSVVQFHQFDLWGSQEGEHNQLEHLREDLGHDYVGVGRDDGEKEGEYSAIFYDPELFRVLEEDTFWLSETPDKPSYGWGVNFRRICTWAKFEHIETGSRFYVYNVHFDHEVQEARENSAKLVREHMNDNVEEELPVIFMGDLNATPENPVYEMVTGDSFFRDAYNITELPPHGPEGTFNGFRFHEKPERRIDYIFFTEHFRVFRYGVLTDNYGLQYPSDHFPVFTEIEILPD